MYRIGVGGGSASSTTVSKLDKIETNLVKGVITDFIVLFRCKATIKSNSTLTPCKEEIQKWNRN